ncbi:hypothetical protein DFH28DRAFT_971891 [Melampsora americana]|nr:hypothetical protein DFH28DRAFT_971891 [Melampsora americana]
MGLVSHIPGIAMSPSLLFQSWRILAERNAASDTSFHEAKELKKTRYVQDMASQLLGWDTTIDWGKDAVEELDTFSGLRSVNRTEADALSLDGSKGRKFDKGNYLKDIEIHIRQSVASVCSIDDATQFDHGSGASIPTKYDGYI